MEIDSGTRIAEILEALKRREMKVYYQPQFDALTSKIVGAEALVRWQRPDGTIIMPGAFIPELEKTDAILELDWYMYKAVCDFLKRKKEKKIHRVPISINFSRKHADEEQFIEKLCGIADEYGIEHKLLVVEVTESAFVKQPEKIAELMDKVKRQGFLIAVDDFGSGLSSLSFVKDISADILKIDRSLLSGNCENEKERIVLESIFLFAHRLKLTTVAEGVETKEQLSFLRTCDCKEIQGFLFARPMPEEDFSRLCEEEPMKNDPIEDILLTQAPSSATMLLLEAVFTCYPLIIFSNLTRNSYYMMAYDNFKIGRAHV